MLAITHVPSPDLEQGQRTYVARTKIDAVLAARQHAEYCRLLERCGATVRILDVNRHLPDCAFVEDTAVVLDEVAVLAAMGAAARKAELAGIEPILQEYREVVRMEPPATLEGGDVVRLGRTLLVGQSSRTNRAGISAMESIVRRFGYRVVSVAVRHCLHLKTACCALPDGRLLINPAWLDMQALCDFACVPVPDEEPSGANVAVIGANVLAVDSHLRTVEQLRRLGFAVQTINLSEFAKAEAGVTCLSLLVH